MVIRRRHLDDVHSRELDGADNPPDRPKQFAGQHAARFGGPGTGRRPGIDDVDIDAQIDRIRPVERLGDCVVDDSLRAPLLDLGHEVVAKAVGLHPFERLDRRPVAAQTDLHEVAAVDGAGFDQPPHRRAVTGEDAPVVVRGIGVGVEMDDPDAARPANLGDRRRRGPRDRVIATEDDRDRPGPGHLVDLVVDEGVGPLDPGGDDVRVAGIDHGQQLERLDAELERVDRARRVLRLADCAWPEPGTGPVAHGVVERRSDDGHVDGPGVELGRIGDPRQVHEGRGPDVGGELEVRVDLVLTVPAVGGGEVAAGGRVGIVGALGHGTSGDGRGESSPRCRSSRWGRRRFASNVQRGAPRPS